ncbi:unnamed protein product, partial [Amoebophrya sp. A25]|eukprot:GSA25T00022947001.1
MKKIAEGVSELVEGLRPSRSNAAPAPSIPQVASVDGRWSSGGRGGTTAFPFERDDG